jgi:hypothetical protein
MECHKAWRRGKKGGPRTALLETLENWEILNLIDFTRASRRAHANQETRIGGSRGSNLTGVKHKHDDVRSVSA